MAAADFRFGHFHCNVGCQGAQAFEQVHFHDRGVTGGHQHDHGFTDRTAHADHQRREDARARGEDHHAGHGLPRCGTEGQGAQGQTARHAEHGVFGDGVDVRDDREAHGQADHQGVALVVGDAQVVGDPHAHVAAEEPVLHERAHVQRQPAYEQDHRNQQRTFPAIRDFQADRLRQAAEGKTGDQDADRQQHQQAEDAWQMPFHIGREEQAGKETEDHRRHRFHQFDHRLDLAAHARSHEVRGVDRSGNGQWSGQQHGVERGFQGTEGQR